VTNVLVCVKRVPDTGGDVALTADGQGVDARHLGFTISAHESCAVELAVRIAAGNGTAGRRVGMTGRRDRDRSRENRRRVTS